MKKVLLIMLLVFSLIGLSSCGVKAKELKINGDSTKIQDIMDFSEKVEEYNEENDIKDQWYSIKYTSTVETEDYEETITVTGTFNNTRFAFDSKIKLTATIEVDSEDEDGNEEKTKTKVEYVLLEGKEYCKVVNEIKTKDSNRKNVSYDAKASSHLVQVMSIIDMVKENSCLLKFSVSEDIYEIKNGFAGETLQKNYLTQVIYKYNKKTFAPKSLEMYSNIDADKRDTETYVYIKTKLFGLVNEPKHSEKYN